MKKKPSKFSVLRNVRDEVIRDSEENENEEQRGFGLEELRVSQRARESVLCALERPCPTSRLPR